jgi:hypothetical protein
MLHELALDLAGAQSGDEDDEDDDDDDGDRDDDDGGDDDDDDDDDDNEGDDDEPEGNEDEDRGRQIASHASELLRQRALAGLLDPRAVAHLASVSGDPSRSDEQRREIADIVAASGDAAERAGRPLEDDPDMN